MTSLPRQVFDIKQKYLHSGFTYETFNNDIALLRLKNEVDLNVFPPACLPRVGLNKENVPVWITGNVVWPPQPGAISQSCWGWGVLSEDTFNTPDELNELRLRWGFYRIVLIISRMSQDGGQREVWADVLWQGLRLRDKERRQLKYNKAKMPYRCEIYYVLEKICSLLDILEKNKQKHWNFWGLGEKFTSVSVA